MPRENRYREMYQSASGMPSGQIIWSMITIIFTDLLLTSDLKGYIHQPGYYFASPSPRKQTELDILLMVHGWRKYDMSQAISTAPFTPLQLPEAQLVLNGQVKSTILKNKLKDIALSVICEER